MYLHRMLETAIKRDAHSFPALVVTGPRQSGKTTLLKNLPGIKGGTYLSLEDPRTRGFLEDDPKGYLEALKRPVVLDEIQYFPEITTHIKMLVDENRKAGQWFLTGSQQYSVMKNVSESMAGRAAILALPPLQLRERKKLPLIDEFISGSTYPEPLTKPAMNRETWYSSYLQTYLERDIRMQSGVGDLGDFERLMRLLAARTSQVLNYSSLAGPLGVSVPTVKRWVSMLESSYIIHLLPPYHENFGKRIIKAPKLYFLDPGLVGYLLRLDPGPPPSIGPMAGALFETAVISEMVKSFYGMGKRPEFYYWHSQGGMEVDLLIPEKGGITPIEIKMTSRLRVEHARNLKYWMELSGNKGRAGILITDSRENGPLTGNITNRHWTSIGAK